MDNTLQAIETLVLIMAIRKTISGAEEPPISEIIQTGIMDLVAQILRLNDTSDEIRVMKVSIFWRLTLSVA